MTRWDKNRRKIRRGFVDISEIENSRPSDLGPIGVNWDKLQKWYQSIHLVSRITNLPHIPCVPLCCPTMEFVCIHGNKMGQHVP